MHGSNQPELKRSHSRREKVLGSVLATAMGATALAGAFGAGLGLGRNMDSNRGHNTTLYAFTTDGLDQSYGGLTRRTIEVDPTNHNDQFYLAAYNAAGGKGAEAAYVSIDGGKTWAYVDRPAANGINRDDTTQVIGASFAPARDNNITLHGPGEEFEVSYASQDGREISTELAVANQHGITPVDVESVYGVSPANNDGAWTNDEHGAYSYSLPLMDSQGQPLKPLQVSEPQSGK